MLATACHFQQAGLDFWEQKSRRIIGQVSGEIFNLWAEWLGNYSAEHPGYQASYSIALLDYPL